MCFPQLAKCPSERSERERHIIIKLGLTINLIYFYLIFNRRTPYPFQWLLPIAHYHKIRSGSQVFPENSTQTISYGCSKDWKSSCCSLTEICKKKEEITDTHNKSLETWKLIYKTSLTESKEKKRQNTYTISNDFASIERIIPGWESEGKRDKQ